MKTILDLYAKMVSKGEWKDYGLTIGPKEISFDIYQKSSDRPILKILKNINPRNKDETYLLKDRNGFIIERSENLESLIKNKLDGFLIKNYSINLANTLKYKDPFPEWFNNKE